MYLVGEAHARRTTPGTDVISQLATLEVDGDRLTDAELVMFLIQLLVAGNTMAQAVRERTEELGVLKALGFTNGQVLGLILAESCFLSLLGGLLGLGIAWALISAGDPTHGSLPMFYFPTRDLVVGIALVLALGLATGIFPAVQAMRLRIADALRRM